MAGYPGEDMEMPQKIIDALQTQPLSYLTPKDGLASLINAPLTSQIPLDKSAFTSTLFSDYARNDESSMTHEDRTSFKLEDDDILGDESTIVYKRPSNIKHFNPSNNSPDDLYEGLSQTAKEYLVASNPQIKTNDIILNDPIERQNKRNLEDISNTSLNLSDNKNTGKKFKTASGVTMNQTDFGEQYLQDLEELLKLINIEPVEGKKNMEYWLNITEDKDILNDESVRKLLMILRNIIKVPHMWNKMDVENLSSILSLMADNIELVENSSLFSTNKSTLKSIAYMSISVIFTVLLMNNDSRKLHLERYILLPIEFLTISLEEIKEQNQLKNPVGTDITLMQESIRSFPDYIRNRPYLDEGLLTKLVYFFTELIMDSDVELTNDISTQHAWESIKLTSTDIVISLFEKVPMQREFILDELLANCDKMSNRRIHRKLHKIDKETYITHFTTAVVSMIENVNCYNFCIAQVAQPEIDLSIITSKLQEQEGILDTFIDHINNTILDRVFENTTKYRHVLENFVADLVALVKLPNWPVSVNLLTSLTRKLLGVFDSYSRKSSNIETICLQLISQIECEIYEITCNTRPNEANNLIKLYNYPDNLPQFLESFKKCIYFVTSSNSRKSTGQFLWCMKVTCLLKIETHMKDADEQAVKVKDLVQNEILNIHSSEACSDEIVNVVNLKEDYCSVLHVSDLLTLYEPCLELIISIIGKNKIKLKSTAIKCLSTLARKDKSILSNPLVNTTINELLTESTASSIKDAILDLIGIGSSYVQFYRQINSNYDNDSVTIRKHILKINDHIYRESKDLRTKIFVASRVLMKIEDEEDILIDMAREILLQNWILDINDLESETESLQSVSSNVVDVLAGVAGSSEKCTELFELFLNFYILNKNFHANEDIQMFIRVLNGLTDILVHKIIELQSIESIEHVITIERQNYLKLLAIFADCNTPLITREHILGLYPYLLVDQNSELQYYILHVFGKSIKKHVNFKPKFLHDLETSLLTKLAKMNVRELEEAIPLAWHIASQRNDTTRITKACSSCLILLNPYVNKCGKEPELIRPDGKLQRLIYLSTGFARFCPFSLEENKIAFLQESESLSEYIAKCLLVFSKHNIHHTIRRVSIKNLTKLCGAYPRLFNSKHILKVLDNEFHSSHLDIQLVILESLYDFFLLEEQKSVKQSGINGSFSSKSKSTPETMGKRKKESLNDGICAALVTRFLKHILTICRLPDLKKALVSVRLLKLILKCGYVNPSHCIPTVIALIGSKDKYMKHIASTIFIEIFEKHESLVYNSIPKGIQLGIEYAISVDEVNYYRCYDFLADLQDILSDSKQHASRFSKSINRALNSQISSALESHCDLNKMQGILFINNNISQVEFANQEDFVSLLRIIDLTAEQLRDFIIDEIETGNKTQILKYSIVIQLSLIEIKDYLLEQYGLKDDILALDYTEKSELKHRLLPTIKSLPHSYTEITEKLISLLDDRELSSKFLSEDSKLRLEL